MPKYKKCPRCDLNYILEEEEFCKICQEELRGISHNTEDLDEIEEEGVLCPRCHVNFLNDGETICEACAAEEERKGNSVMNDIEPDWDDAIEEEELGDGAEDLATDDELDISLEEMQEEEEETDEEDEYEDEENKDDFEEIGDVDIDDLSDDEDEKSDDDE